MRTLHEIAHAIRDDWKQPSYAAIPYIDAMACMETADLNEYFGLDRAEEIVVRFLCNSTTWRGEVAREVKAELRRMIMETRR